MLEKNGYNALLDKEPGIWIMNNNEKKKVASIGLAIDNYISYHGVALNIDKNVLKGFNFINPCGMNSNVMSYVDIPREKAINDLLEALEKHFGNFEMVDINKIIY